MLNAQRFPFIEGRDAFGDIDAVPRLPLTLTYQNSVVEVAGYETVIQKLFKPNHTVVNFEQV